MPTLRTPLKRKTRAHISQAAIDAWLAGDIWGLQDALGLFPWNHGVFPPEYSHAYCLPDEPEHDADFRGWPKMQGVSGAAY